MRGRTVVRYSTGIALAAALAANAPAVTVTPQVTDEILVNPGMGLVYYHSAGRLWAYGAKTEPGDALDWFPGVSTIYLRVLWNDLEPEEGEYRWDLIDSSAAAFVAKGKKVGIRVICANQTENAVPQYVRDAGAKGTWFEYKSQGYVPPTGVDTRRWEPDYMDPVYLAKYEKFLKAFAEHYDGSPDVAFVDIGSVGLYGEGHSPKLKRMIKDDEPAYDRMIIHHLDLHRRVLPHTYLVISDDVGGGGWVKREDHPIFAHCRKIGVGLRDDSIFCSQNRPWLSDHFARLFAPLTPVILEGGHYTSIAPRGGYLADRVVECVEKYQASYFSIHDFPRPHLRDFGDALAKVSRRLGYRLAPVKIDYPSEVTVDEPVEIRSDWVNFGVAKCHRGAKLTWSLVNAAGAVCWSSTDLKFDARDLRPTVDAKPVAQSVRSRVRFGHDHVNPVTDQVLLWAKKMGRERDPGDWTVMLKPGRYTLCVSLGTALGKPEIALPIVGKVADARRYAVGAVTVRSNPATPATALDRSIAPAPTPEAVVAPAGPRVCTNLFLRGRTVRENPVGHRVGEKIVFALDLEGDDLLGGDETFEVEYQCVPEGGKAFGGKAPISRQKGFRVETKMTRPGFVRLAASLKDSAKRRLVRDPKTSACRMYGSAVDFRGSAAAEPEKLRPFLAEPADFDAFWTAAKRELAAVPMNPELEEMPDDADRVTRCFKVRLGCVGPRPATGFLTVPRRCYDDPTCKVPVRLEFDGAGCRPQLSRERGKADEIRFHVNAHGVELARDMAYYVDFFAKMGIHHKLPAYIGNYVFDPKDNATPRTSYMFGMVMRVLRAVDFAKTLKEWNGRDLIVCGGSQGGLQTMWAAGLAEGVTRAEPWVTWSCDLGGFKDGRWEANGWRIPFAPGILYYDPVYMARRIPRSCFLDITRVGLGDGVAPPTGIFITYNVCPGPKRIRLVQGNGHDDRIPPQPNQVRPTH